MLSSKYKKAWESNSKPSKLSDLEISQLREKYPEFVMGGCSGCDGRRKKIKQFILGR